MNRSLYRVSRQLTWLALRCLFRLRIFGREQIPARGPVLLVGNHASYMDPLILGVGTDRTVHYLARSGLARIPLLGSWMRAVGTVFVDRAAPTAATLQCLVDVLRQGETVGLFPEGTRTVTGAVGPFKRGFLLLVKKTGATVVPAGIRGSFAAFPRGRRVPRLLQPVSVSFGPALAADEVLRPGGLEEVRRRVAQLCGQPLATSAVPSEGDDAPG